LTTVTNRGRRKKGLSLRLVFVHTKNMAKKRRPLRKKKRGRPVGRSYGETLPVRLTPDMAKSVDRWAAKQGLSRSQAVRALIGKALKK
jgi:hypothetical protein